MSAKLVELRAAQAAAHETLVAYRKASVEATYAEWAAKLRLLESTFGLPHLAQAQSSYGNTLSFRYRSQAGVSVELYLPFSEACRAEYDRLDRISMAAHRAAMELEYKESLDWADSAQCYASTNPEIAEYIAKIKAAVQAAQDAEARDD
jgi:hypothetical protein